MMLFFAILLLYIAGVVKALPVVRGAMYHRFIYQYDPAAAMKSDGYAWKDDFDRMWEGIISERRNLMMASSLVSTGSWITVLVALTDGQGKNATPMFHLPPMPDKEETRKNVLKPVEAYRPKGRRIKIKED